MARLGGGVSFHLLRVDVFGPHVSQLKECIEKVVPKKEGECRSAGEIQERCTRDTGEVQARSRRDAREMQERYTRDMREVRVGDVGKRLTAPQYSCRRW